MTYTPGPWRQSDDELGYGDFDILANANGYPNLGIATVVDGRFSDYRLGTVALHIDVCRANARLISAAPDLLEACEDLLLLIAEHGTPVMRAHATRLSKARSAITKARGIEKI